MNEESNSSIKAPPEPTFAEKVHSRFNSANRQSIPLTLVEEITNSIETEDSIPLHSTPRLILERLIFEGEKTLQGEDYPHSFRYDQRFQSGVNILLIPDNTVGKSSVMKTVKFALTGDDSDYDDDVKQWIHQIWLQFSIDAVQFTSYLARTPSGLRGVLVFGLEERDLNDLMLPNAWFDVSGPELVRERLEQFFFERLGIKKLSWAHGSSQRSTSWRTFFQAMEIPDTNDKYLLCDPEHAMGNQEGLIFSVFLGLRLAEPLNRLGVEASLTKRQEQQSEEELHSARDAMKAISAQLNTLLEQIRQTKVQRDARIQAYKTEAPTQRLNEINLMLIQNVSEQADIISRRDALTRQRNASRAKAKTAREAIAFKLHFTGIEVAICPNCDAEVDTAAMEREEAQHTCRLCSKPAEGASAGELVELTAIAADMEQRAVDMDNLRASLAPQIQQLQGEERSLQNEVALLREVAEKGIEVVTVTQEEEERLADLHEQMGRLRAELGEAKKRAEVRSSESGDADIRLKVVEKTRDVLKGEAQRLNADVLSRLSIHTGEMARKIGAESISDVTCSPLGIVSLYKHGAKVRFTGIQNPGERLRVKLAFFLAMMRIGREPGVGHHPGLLLIDQLGSAEMVEADCLALAKILHQIDAEFASEMQILCFTAREEFQNATVSQKLYGAMPGGYAF